MTEQDDRPDDSQAQAAAVDVTLIDEMLRMLVRQRLRILPHHHG